MKNSLKKSKGITLIALVVTLILLLILAGTSISMLAGENGILSRAAEAKEKIQNSQSEELSALSKLESEMLQNQDDGFDKEKGVNRPELRNGMTRIMFEEPTSDNAGNNLKNGKTIKDGENGWSENWYDYSQKKWANTMTKDGSMWVWIPRFAYNIDSNDKMDILFLVGTSNKCYNTSSKKIEDLPDGYKVHPCFQNGKSNNFKNGEWDSELRGIWIAKFEAGLPDESTAPKTTSVNMTNSYYPVFQGQKTSYNYINASMCYLLSKTLTEANNPYGLTSDTDSHLIKNSEWGAAAYLSYSIFGKTGGVYNADNEVYINNVSYSEYSATSTVNSIRGNGSYAITGYSGSAAGSGQNILTKTELKDSVSGSSGTSYAWYTFKGTNASTTGNIYGIYDMSGGLSEYTASYIKMENSDTLLKYLKDYGYAFVFTDSTKTQFVGNTKYVMEYPEYTKGGLKTELSKTGRYGDGYLETWHWFGDWINDDASGPFTTRGADWDYSSEAGVFAFDDDGGYGSNYLRFPLGAGCPVAL